MYKGQSIPKSHVPSTVHDTFTMRRITELLPTVLRGGNVWGLYNGGRRAAVGSLLADTMRKCISLEPSERVGGSGLSGEFTPLEH